MKRYTDILWDFNGTILDDVQIGIDSVNVLLAERGLEILQGKEGYRQVFGFPIIDYYRRLGFDFDKESYEDEIAPLWVSEYQKRSPLAQLCTGVVEALEHFRNKGLRQTVLSMSELAMLSEQIEKLGIKEYFFEICGLDNINAHSKMELALAWRRLNPDAVALFIGDTEHDADTARMIGADCVLVAGGHQSVRILKECGCTVVESLLDIPALIE